MIQPNWGYPKAATYEQVMHVKCSLRVQDVSGVKLLICVEEWVLKLSSSFFKKNQKNFAKKDQETGFFAFFWNFKTNRFSDDKDFDFWDQKCEKFDLDLLQSRRCWWRHRSSWRARPRPRRFIQDRPRPDRPGVWISRMRPTRACSWAPLIRKWVI